MKSNEPYILPKSDYYIYTPASNRPEFLFYCCSAGHFYYEKGYTLKRDSYDSYLLIYIKSGVMNFSFDESYNATVEAGQCLLLNCYRPHTYSCTEDCECFWCHFDGGCSCQFFSYIASTLSPLPVISGGETFFSSITAVFTALSAPLVNEPLISDKINQMLTCFLQNNNDIEETDSSSTISKAMAYIGNNFSKQLSIEELAHNSGFSVWHFIRLFKSETGFTPHEYLIRVRINAASYMLSSTTMPIKEICYACGYSGESVFSTAFKRETGKSPNEYRNNL